MPLRAHNWKRLIRGDPCHQRSRRLHREAGGAHLPQRCVEATPLSHSICHGGSFHQSVPPEPPSLPQTQRTQCDTCLSNHVPFTFVSPQGGSSASAPRAALRSGRVTERVAREAGACPGLDRLLEQVLGSVLCTHPPCALHGGPSRHVGLPVVGVPPT